MNKLRPSLARTRRIATQLLERPAAQRSLLAFDRMVLSVALRGRRTTSGINVILNSPGEGNIGDQAMFESFVVNVEGPVLAIVKSADAYSLRQDHEDSRVEFLVLPALVYSKFVSHFIDLWRFGRAVRGARSFSIMGADIMDGGYGQHSSLVEWNIAYSVHKSGVPSRILGFSWNGAASREIVHLARKAGKCGIQILPRDPDSYERLVQDNVQCVRQTADMVFAFKADQSADPDQPLSRSGAEHQSGDAPLAVVNVSGLIGNRINQGPEYDVILNSLRRLGYRTVLLPHVSHSNVDDIAATTSLRQNSSLMSDCLFIPKLMTPTEVQDLVAGAKIVITGRMHLSILALSMGTPAIVLATQGKVAGLMKLFGFPEHCVEPTPGFGSEVSLLIEKITAEPTIPVAKIRDNLVKVQQLASINFEGI